MSPRTHHRVSRGVSLIEVLLVVGLLALALGLFSGMLGSGLDGLRLRNASKELAAQLRYTRAAAIHTGEPQVLALDVDAAHWHTGRRQGDLSGKPTLDVLTAAQEQVQEGEARFRFFPDGSSTGGSITLSKGKASWRIDVLWLTGAIRLSPATGS
ncbi:MAG: GspH/FimT family pseudopilin [Xanthomonadaceae bacterium]|nr:GspH/FimT family pseudopilin [Xanthomonadaceae bacterium]MDP2184649.1 GspH/FimT family pseudopilin [Xanthomonadales bacterium]MDZ4116147.1 GspH/FimT family pseudopilin [Xanthomonadaceae bacterium]MDZ4378047.1 GspH/FimT family pseudopilin [Xanthomonadaceae bacterium]